MWFRSRGFWSRFRDAYGAAGDVADLMAELDDGCFDEQLAEDLWSRLCHQLTIYSASFPAVVALQEILDSADIKAQTALLPLAGGIEMVRRWRSQPVTGIDEEDYRVAVESVGKQALKAIEISSFAIDSVDDLTGLLSAVAVAKGHWRLGSGLRLYELESFCPKCDHVFPSYGVLSRNF